MASITQFETIRDNRLHARQALKKMKEIEANTKLVSFRLDEKTVIATTAEKLDDLKERHGYGQKKDSPTRDLINYNQITGYGET